MSRPTSSNQSNAQESTPRYPYRRNPRTSNATRVDRTSFLFLFALIASLFIGSDLDAQQRMKNLGTRGSEISMESTPTSDGNYVTVGPVTRPPNNPAGPGIDIYLNKVDPLGALIWSRKIASFSDIQLNNFPVSVTETVDATGNTTGFAITGMVFPTPFNSLNPVFIATTDANGFPIAYNTYGGVDLLANAGATRGFGVQIIQTPQGELAVCGSLLLSNNAGQVPFILVVDMNLGIRFMRLYHDSRYVTPIGANIAGHFADIEAVGLTTPNGVIIPDGYVVVGTTSKLGDPFTEIVVMRTDIDGNPLMIGLYGPEQKPSRGTAITVASNGSLEVVGLQAFAGAPPTTLVLNLDTLTGIQFDLDLYYGFMSIGDIRQLANGDFILNGRDPNAPEAALLRIKPDGTPVFAIGYGGPNVELYTDVHEMTGGDLFATGLTTTWCQGPIDEYLVRTQSDGIINGCDEYNLNLDVTDPGYPQRGTWMEISELTESIYLEVGEITPNTIVRLICPLPIIVWPMPWDWFIRADFNRDLAVNVADVIGTLDHLFGGGPASVPEQAADANNDGNTDLGDAVYSLNYLFSDGTAPAAPFGEPGPDPSTSLGNIFTIDELQEYLQSALGDGTSEIQAVNLGY